MNKTIYIRDEDVSVWERAKELAGEKLAPVIMDGLRTFVAAKERERPGFERIEVHFRNSRDHDVPAAKAFVGRWIFDREQPFIHHTRDASGWETDAHHFAIAVTAKNRIVVLSWSNFGEGDSSYTFDVFEDLNALKRAGFHNDVKAAVVEKFGVEVEELDI